MIWGNQFFMVNEKCLYSKSFMSSGFIYIRDILNENGKVRENVYHDLSDKTKFLHVISMITTALKPYKLIKFSNDNVLPTRKKNRYRKAI